MVARMARRSSWALDSVDSWLASAPDAWDSVMGGQEARLLSGTEIDLTK